MRLVILAVALMLFVGCKTRANLGGAGELAGHWATGCRLQSLGGTLFSFKKSLVIAAGGVVHAQSTHFSDHLCMVPLTSDEMQGRVRLLSHSDREYHYDYTTERAQFVVQDEEMLDTFNRLGIAGGNWQVGARRDIHPSPDAAQLVVALKLDSKLLEVYPRSAGEDPPSEDKSIYLRCPTEEACDN